MQKDHELTENIRVYKELIDPKIFFPYSIKEERGAHDKE
jgi:hypothetical protein